MKKNKGFTLLEVQISSLIMVVVLIATGVIFYFALSSIRYLHDSFTVYTNAVAAMKIITNEVMVSNCYGSSSFGNPGYVPDTYSFYGADGYVAEGPAVSNNPAGDAYGRMPSLGGVNDLVDTDGTSGMGLFLRQATPSSAVRGDLADTAGDFPWHETVHIYLDNTVEPGEVKLVIDRQDFGSPGGVVSSPFQVIANNVTRFAFQPIAYNMLHVFLTVEGNVPDPWGGVMHSISLSKAITLRCAPSVTPIPDGTTW